MAAASEQIPLEWERFGEWALSKKKVFIAKLYTGPGLRRLVLSIQHRYHGMLYVEQVNQVWWSYMNTEHIHI